MAILIQYANGVPGVKFSLDAEEVTIGRALDNDICVDDEFVSKRHAVIQLIQDESNSRLDCILIDADSTNHVYVNGVKITAHRLEEKDKIHIGQNEFRFSTESISPIELGQSYSGFFNDEAPGLMHAKVQQANAPTSRLDAVKSTTTTFTDVPLDGYDVEELSDTRHQIDNIIDAADVSDQEDIDNSLADKNKRFSRRLSLIT